MKHGPASGVYIKYHSKSEVRRMFVSTENVLMAKVEVRLFEYRPIALCVIMTCIEFFVGMVMLVH